MELGTTCIVGIGAVLPEAPNVDMFWENLMAGRCSIKPLPESRWKYSNYMVTHAKIYSNYAASIEESEISKIKNKFGFKDSEINRLQAMTLEASCQALKNIPQNFYNKTFISLGCMGPDEMAAKYEFTKEHEKLKAFFEVNGMNGDVIEEVMKKYKHTIKNSPIELVITTSVIHLLQKVFSLKGEYCFVDAACASSLAAIDVAINSLMFNEADIAISGGIESQLGPENFSIFCTTGLHSKRIGYPLDNKSDGINQGEGAVVFVLMRTFDAIKYKIPILAIIKSIAGSSNGKLSSLFSPTKLGQLIALKKVYRDFKKVDYIECHATGTRVGDSTEIEALDDFFKEEKPIPVGSVKALIGHTKGASGAAGLLKAILMIKHQKIPPSTYFEYFIDNKKPTSLFVNKEPINFDFNNKLRIGISSAGFGGINYHVLIEEYRNEEIFKINPFTKKEKLVLLHSSYLQKKDAKKFFTEYGFKIPPLNLPYIDDLQIMALELVSETLDALKIDINKIDLERVEVISASCLGIDTYLELAKKLRHIELLNFLDDIHKEKVLSHMENYISLNEEIGPGSLNNVIAGRIMNQFDLRGKSFNIDSDYNSLFLALKIAKWELLANQCDYIFLVISEDEIKENPVCIERLGLYSLFVTKESFSKKLKTEPIAYIDDLIYYRDEKKL